MLLASLVALGVLAAEPIKFPEPAKLPSHAAMPDPLVMFDGRRVTTKEQWVDAAPARAEGACSSTTCTATCRRPRRSTATVEREDRHYFGGKATKKEITLAFGPPDTPKIHLLLVVPNDRKGPAPVFVGMNFCGNHALVNDPSVPLPTVLDVPADARRQGQPSHRSGPRQADRRVGPGAVDRPRLRRGDVLQRRRRPRPAGRARAASSRTSCKPGKKPGPHDWGTIAAWAWGIQRAVDYLVTDKDLDATRIAVVGHSRLGKTALLAGRVRRAHRPGHPAPGRLRRHRARAAARSASRSRRSTTAFPHWFDATFKEFNDQPDRLPFDQNCLVALVRAAAGAVQQRRRGHLGQPGRASSRCCRRPTRSTACSAPAAWTRSRCRESAS